MSDDVTMTVNGKEFTGWQGVTITRALDTCADAVALTAPFDHDRRDMRDAFRPFGYQPATVTIDSERVLTGRIESIDASLTSGDRSLSIQGRSLTGSLIDCAIDGIGYQFDGLTLAAIARKVCQPFDIDVIVQTDSPKISEARATPGQGAFDFLSSLAASSGLLITCDIHGRLVIGKPDPAGAPVAALVEGQGPFVSVSASYNGTGRWSMYKVHQQQDGKPNVVGTADDNGVKIYRPNVQTGSDGDAKNVQDAARWARSLAYADAVRASVQLSGWRNPAGKVWAPGQVVTLRAASVFILQETRYMVRSVTLTLDESGRTAGLELVLPAVYTGELPATEPWAEKPTPPVATKTPEIRKSPEPAKPKAPQRGVNELKRSL